ncbi:HIRAN domain-containing protein [Sphingomonas sp. T9W2]|uniref:HIRAN domain-containing protein n=1 Tax=Sphingomonas sp. T9W2 TaxID=3143183 RepID=UPI0031F52DEC
MLSLHVVGAAHLNANGTNRRSEIIFANPGDPIELRREPKNPVDPYAVAVYTARGFQIGYLTAERAPWIGGMLAQGKEVAAIFQTETPWGAMLRVGLDGAVPTLPPQSADSEKDEVREYDDDGFWPDPEPPDDFDY